MRRTVVTTILLLLALGGCTNNSATPTAKSDSKAPPTKSSETTKAPDPKDEPDHVVNRTTKPTAGTGKSYILRVKDTVGSKWQYQYVMDTFADPSKCKDPKLLKVYPSYASAHVDGKYDMEVTAVKDGWTTFHTVSKMDHCEGKGPFKEQADQMKNDKPQVQDFTWDDQMNNVKLEKGTYYDIMTNCMSGLFPKEDVQVGSTWEYKPFPEGSVNAKAKLEAAVKLAGRDALLIHVVLPATIEGETNDMDIWIDPSNGRYLQIKMLSQSNQSGLVIQNKFSQTLKS